MHAGQVKFQPNGLRVFHVVENAFKKIVFADVSAMFLWPLDPSAREWLDLAAEWLTAIGTVGAVIVALRLSRRDKKPCLTVIGAVHRYVEEGQTYAEGVPLVVLTATNTGYVPVSVCSPCWRIGVFRRKVLFQIAPKGFTQTELNTYGQRHSITFPASQFFEGWEVMREEIRRRRWPLLAIASLRWGFDTTVGKRFFGPLNWELKKLIRDDFFSNR